MTIAPDPKPLLVRWLDVKTVSEANTASHGAWVDRHKRSKSQGATIISTLYAASVGCSAWAALRLPLHIVLERHSTASKPLDDDNLPASLKGAQDGVCDALGLYMAKGHGPRRMSNDPLAKNKHFDDSDRLTWSYRQVIGAKKAGVAVRMYTPGAMADAIRGLLRDHGVNALMAWLETSEHELDRILP